MSLFRLDENVNERYNKLLGENITKEHIAPKSFFIEGKVTDP